MFYNKLYKSNIFPEYFFRRTSYTTHHFKCISVRNGQKITKLQNLHLMHIQNKFFNFIQELCVLVELNLMR